MRSILTTYPVPAALLVAFALSVSLAPLSSALYPDRPSSEAGSEAAKSKTTAVASDASTKPAEATAPSPVKPLSPQVLARQQKLDAATAKGVNRIPGVNLKVSDMAPTPVDPPITGFHPIKKLMHPIVQLERNSVDLQKQIMRLTGPIAGLQGPMLGLQKKMDGVEKRMVGMQGAIGTMQSGVGDAASGMSNVNHQLNGVRSDLRAMRQDISDLRKPIVDLQKPLHELQGPLGSVSQPLNGVYKELAEMKALLGAVLAAIVMAAFAIAIGTPIAAVIIYRNRRKLFPHMSDHDFPGAKVSDKKSERETLTRV